jgi:hypothetical protein
MNFIYAQLIACREWLPPVIQAGPRRPEYVRRIQIAKYVA